MNRNWLQKDFYRLLDVDKGADQATIKKSYRRLAQKLHPDANPGDTKAADRFKEVSEAYSVLSDPERRKEYDQVRSLGAGAFNTSAGGPGPFGNQQVRIEDLLGDIGGIGDLFRFGGGRRGPQRGSDISTALDLSFEESVKGTTASVRIEKPDACRRCGGRGAEPGTSFDVCSGCGGTGTVASNQGFFSFTNPCPGCNGSGRTMDTPCASCRGSGQGRSTRTLKVRIPPGVKDRNSIRLRGRGSPGLRGGPPGDLLVEVHVADHPTFSRNGDDLLLKLPVTFTEAALGAKVRVPTLNGPVTLKIPPGTSSGRTFRVRKEGVRRDRGRPGDLLVTVQVAVPPKLSKDARKMLEEFRERYETENPRDNL